MWTLVILTGLEKGVWAEVSVSQQRQGQCVQGFEARAPPLAVTRDKVQILAPLFPTQT